MKVEIGESVILSWLRHVEGCQVVQLNWKPSPRWNRSDDGRIARLLERAVEFFGEGAADIFKKTKGDAQLIRQAEVDALGLRLSGGSVEKIIAVDTVFHAGGLNYGSTEATVARVTKKMIRAALAAHEYFPDAPPALIFAAPVIHRATAGPLEAAFVRLTDFARVEGLTATFRLIANDDYRSEIIAPLRDVAGDVADTSELFLRSVQLLDLCSPAASRAEPRAARTPTQPQDGIVPIGEFVRSTLSRLIVEKSLPPDVMTKLQEPAYCKSTFDMNYPVLRLCRDSNDAREKRMINGYSRYRSELVAGEYLLCNDWYERNRERYERWLRNVGQQP